MRLHLIILSLLLLFSTSLVQARVLLPESNRDKETTPNLGLNPTRPQKTMAPVKKIVPVKVKPTPAPITTQITTLKKPPPQKRKFTKEPAYTPRKLKAVSKEDIKQDLANNFDKYIPDSLKKILPANYKEHLKKTFESLNINSHDNITETTLINDDNIRLIPGGVIKSKKLTAHEIMIQNYNNIPKSTEMRRLLAKKQRLIDKKLSRPLLFLEDTPITKVSQKDLKKKITISSLPNYIWGEKDIKRITHTLGYKRKEIVKNCQIRHIITLETDSDLGSYSAVLWGESNTLVKYDGAVETIKFRSMAICHQPKSFPTRGGIVTRVGNKFGVTLSGRSQCKPTGTYVARLMTKYIGDGDVQCSYK